MGRGIGNPHVILGIDKAAAKEVLPIPIDEHLREERILVVDHPVREGAARVLVGGQLQWFAAQRGGRQTLSGAGILRAGGAALVIDALLAWLLAWFACDGREERFEAVVVVLAPLLVGMVVALRTLQADSHEDLCDILHLLLAVSDRAVPDDRRILSHFSRGRHEVPHELVVGTVVLEGLANPGVERETTPGLHGRFAFVAENGGPLAREVVSIGVAGQQLVDLAGALVGIGVRKEGIRLRHVGNPPGDVDRDAAQEGGVVAHPGGRESEGFQFGKDALVDQVDWFGQVFNRRSERNGRAENVHLFLESNHDRGASRLILHGNETVLVHLRHLFVVRFVLHRPRDVPGGVVAEIGGDSQLLGGLGIGEAILGRHLDARQLGIVLGPVGQPLPDPAHEKLVVVALLLQPRAALVGELATALEDEETVFRGGTKDPASPGLLHKVLVVVPRFIAEEGKFESILSVCFSVTATAVASLPGQYRNHFIGKADRNECSHEGNGDLHRRALHSGEGGSDGRLSVHESAHESA